MLVISFCAWLGFAYFNPNTASGRFLIKVRSNLTLRAKFSKLTCLQYRPGAWRWRQTGARYTAASIHMWERELTLCQHTTTLPRESPLCQLWTSHCQNVRKSSNSSDKCNTSTIFKARDCLIELKVRLSEREKTKCFIEANWFLHIHTIHHISIIILLPNFYSCACFLVITQYTRFVMLIFVSSNTNPSPFYL